ncbi:MAG: hypothetical protein BWY20_01874 [Spirochaetes bacterium ADurb.Bin215]|nr:MAG: hypothetical protein BWY20_01874 [Spirochaetes bacterium ADurb.Bin215]
MSQVVLELAFFEYLQEKVEDFRMRFFNFIEKDNRIGVSAYFFGEHAPVLKTDVSGRGSYKPRGIVFFHVIAHVYPDQQLFLPEQEFRQGFCEQGFSDTGRTEEYE